MRHCHIRIFIPGGGLSNSELRWRNLAISYVQALIDFKLEPLLLAVPFVSLDKYDPLFGLRDYFFGRLDMPYVNVVFGIHPIPKANVLTGLKEMQRATDRKRGLAADTEDLEEPGEVSNLERLWTSGVPNVAVVAQWPRDLTPGELQVLQQKYTVFVPSSTDLDHFDAILPNVLYGPPDVFAYHFQQWKTNDPNGVIR